VGVLGRALHLKVAWRVVRSRLPARLLGVELGGHLPQ
jgi:hypothetical protein